VSVCGTVLYSLSLEVFPGTLTTPASLSRSLTRLQCSPQPVDFPADLISSHLRPGQPSPGLVSPHASPHRNCKKYGNIHPFPIDYAFQPRLRSRLTLRRRPLLRKPWTFGGKESHLPFRYSYLHSHFPWLHNTSPCCFYTLGNVHLPPTFRLTRGFGIMLSPVTLSAHVDSTSELLRTL
jgi:hypothetical protein